MVVVRCRVHYGDLCLWNPVQAIFKSGFSSCKCGPEKWF
jgi:hypothetical protein